MEKLLITGSTGSIGSSLLEHLLCDERFSRYEICCTARNVDKCVKHDRVKAISVDLQDSEKVRQAIKDIKPKTMIHIAWNCKNYNDLCCSDQYDWVMITMNLLKSFYDSGGHYFLSIGSFFEKKDNTDYARCKRFTHNIIQDFSCSTGMKYCYARLFNVVSIRESNKLIPYIIKSIKNNLAVQLKTPDQIIDCVHVDDVSNQILNALYNNVCGEFDIGSGFGVRVKDILACTNLIKHSFENNTRISSEELSQIEIFNQSSNPRLIAKIDNVKNIEYLYNLILKIYEQI